MASAAGIEQSRAALNIAASGEQHKNILGEQPAPDATCADIGEGARGLHAGLGLRDGRGGNAVLEGDEGGQADLVEVQHGARPLRCLTVSRAALPYVRLGKAVRVDVVRAVKAVDELGNEAERRQRKIRRAAKRARRARRAAAEAAAVGQPGIGAEQGVKPEVGGQNADVGAGAGCREMAQKENGANDGGGQPGGIGGVLREGKLQEGAGEPAGRSPKRRKVVGEGLVPGGEEKLKLQTGAAGLGPLTGMGAGGPAAEEGLEASRQAASALAQGCGRADAHAGVPSAGEDHEQHAKVRLCSALWRSLWSSWCCRLRIKAPETLVSMYGRKGN